MILTPEERRAVVTLAMLLAFGQAIAWWEKRESSKPDAELSAWLTHIAQIRASEDTVAAESSGVANVAWADSASTSAPLLGAPLTIAEPREKQRERLPVPVLPSKKIPPGILETGKLRINDATAEQLESLPGIGPALAQRIIAARRERPFSSADDLSRVSGIGPRTLERLRPQIEVAPPQPASAK